jgi:peptide/nickel transport system substrate-binding protein
MMDPKVFAEPKDYALVAGERMEVVITDPQTVTFKMPAPKPGLLAHFATSYAQGWQPKHFLGQFHPAINPDADKLAKSMGFDDG